MRLMPTPCGIHDDVEVVELGTPPEVATRPLARGDEPRRIARPPRTDCVRHPPLTHPADRVEHLAHRHPAPAAEIVCARGAARLEAPERGDMRGREVADVHVVAN